MKALFRSLTATVFGHRKCKLEMNFEAIVSEEEMNTIYRRLRERFAESEVNVEVDSTKFIEVEK